MHSEYEAEERGRSPARRHLAADERLVEGEQRFVDEEDVEDALGNEVFHNEVALACVGESVAGAADEIARLVEGQLQGHGKCDGGGFTRLVRRIAANLRE